MLELAHLRGAAAGSLREDDQRKSLFQIFHALVDGRKRGSGIAAVDIDAADAFDPFAEKRNLFERILPDERDLMIFYDIQKSQNVRVGLMIGDENDRTMLGEIFLVDDADIDLHAFDDMVRPDLAGF